MMEDSVAAWQTDRRGVLRMSGALTLTAAAGHTDAAVDAPASPPSRGRKFTADGRVMGDPGNPLVCHLAQQGAGSACFNALLDIYREAPAHAFMRKVTLLPPSSYHMTVFNGAADKERDVWPTAIPADAPIAS